jgi:hypothetical protein
MLTLGGFNPMLKQILLVAMVLFSSSVLPVESASNGQVAATSLTLSKAVNLTGAYTIKSGPDFRGVYGDRVYVKSAGGQFYYHDLKKRTTFTYENLVREAFVDKTTGNVLFTRETIGKDGTYSVYRALKEYPKKEVVLYIPKSAVLENTTFFKDFALLSFYDNAKYTSFVKVVPMKGKQLSPLGAKVSKLFTANLSHTVTDGKRLLAFDRKLNSIVELTTGSSKVISKVKKESYGLSLAVYGKNVLVSYTDSNDKGQLILNGKVIGNQSHSEMAFYNESSVFLTTGQTLELLNVVTKNRKRVDGISSHLVTTSSALYYQTEKGDIKKIGIRSTK